MEATQLISIKHGTEMTRKEGCMYSGRQQQTAKIKSGRLFKKHILPLAESSISASLEAARTTGT